MSRLLLACALPCTALLFAIAARAEDQKLVVPAVEGKAAQTDVKPNAGGAAGVDFVSLSGGVLQLDGGNFNGQRVAPFKLARTATTVAQYRKCADAGACSAPNTGGKCNWGTQRTDHPVNCVDWNQAVAFCTWAKARLPTAQEREWAASSGEGWKYPWGNQEPGSRACWDGPGSDRGAHGWSGTCPVGSHAAGNSKQGVADLAGNVWDWLSTEYGDGKEQRGGSWGGGGNVKNLRASNRDSDEPADRLDAVGFRCAK
jgi:sulfatase modifying factor 1